MRPFMFSFLFTVALLSSAALAQVVPFIATDIGDPLPPVDPRKYSPEELGILKSRWTLERNKELKRLAAEYPLKDVPLRKVRESKEFLLTKIREAEARVLSKRAQREAQMASGLTLEETRRLKRLRKLYNAATKKQREAKKVAKTWEERAEGFLRELKELEAKESGQAAEEDEKEGGSGAGSDTKADSKNDQKAVLLPGFVPAAQNVAGGLFTGAGVGLLGKSAGDAVQAAAANVPQVGRFLANGVRGLLGGVGPNAGLP